mgnify:CR=1 FL=1
MFVAKVLWQSRIGSRSVVFVYDGSLAIKDPQVCSKGFLAIKD